MTALEAKNKTVLINTINENSQLNEILKLIDESVNKGEYEIWYYKFIKSDVEIKLTELGYNVGNTQYERNETLTKISWK